MRLCKEPIAIASSPSPRNNLVYIGAPYPLDMVGYIGYHIHIDRLVKGETNMAQAKRGGQVGVNGELYEGGQFLPSTTLPKGISAKSVKVAKVSKQEIAPYVWELPPTTTARAIWGRVSTHCLSLSDTSGILTIMPNARTYDGQPLTAERHAYVTDLIAKWNTGARWV